MKKALYREFSDSVYAAAKAYEARTGKRVLLEVMIELTRLCSIKCTHCYIGEARWKKDPEEMQTPQLLRLFDHLAENGTLWICFTGGEALMRKDFKEIWLYAKRKGFILTLFTNATLITEEMADFLAAHPPFAIEVSIYGATEATYEAVSLVKGSFRRFRRGIENLRARPGLRWVLKTVVIRENQHELARMEELAGEWGVDFKFDSIINASLGKEQIGGKAPCATRLDASAVNRVELGNERRLRETLDLVHKQLPNPEDNDHRRSERLFGCGAGQNNSYFTAQGEMQMCLVTPNYGGPVFERSLFSQERLARLWDRFGEARRQKLRPDAPCRDCDIALLCSNCPGMAFLETGDEHGAVEYLCRMTHEKAALLKIPHLCNERHFCHHSTTTHQGEHHARHEQQESRQEALPDA